MQSNTRLNTISDLLNTALDSEEEYVYQGEMSDYMRTYAGDAADELDSLFRARTPSESELRLFVKALSDPGRLKRGRSKALLLRLRETGRPFLDALADSPDPELRIFSLQTGVISMNPYFFNPLYGSITLEQRLMEDPDERVRAAALETAQQTIVHNAPYLEKSLQRGASNPLLAFLSRIAAHLDDPSPKVRAEAAKVMVRWAVEAGEETLELFLDRENNPTARKLLAKSKAPSDSATTDVGNGRPALNDSASG
jgi:hypothetical protein